MSDKPLTGRISDDDFQKALDSLSFPVEHVDPAKDEKIEELVTLDPSDFLKSLVDSVGESNESLAKSIGRGFGGMATLLKSMSDRIDDLRDENNTLRKRLDEIETAPVSGPKGRPSAQPLEKTFTTEDGEATGGEKKVTAEGLNRMQIKLLMGRDMSGALRILT